jgi:hypothetical protein
MAFAQVGDEINTTVTIESVKETEGRNGGQWELEVKWPWSVKYSDRVWLDQNTFEKPSFGTHNVVAYCRSQKDNNDGSQGWMFRWGILEFGDDGGQQDQRPARPQSTPAPASGSNYAYQHARDKRITWNSAVNNAVNIWCACRTMDSDHPLEYAQIQAIAQRIYAMVHAGPDSKEYLDEVVAQIQESVEFDGKSAIESAAEQYNHDIRNGGSGELISKTQLGNYLVLMYGKKQRTLEARLKALSPAEVLELQNNIANGDFHRLLQEAMQPDEEVTI